ncbi:MAG: hypothetical protein WD080_03870 [Egibacteraceae bacterium]
MQVVFDAQLLIAATAYAGASWLDWPDVPPVTNNPEQDCLALVASAPRYGDVSLILSRGLLTQVQAALADDVGLLQRDIDDYIMAVLTLANASGGGVEDDPPDSGTGHAPHVAVPLELARRGRLLVAEHRDVGDLGPFWGPEQVPILTARDFSGRVDAARRAT